MPDYRPPPDKGLALVHHDDAMVVVDKPAGLLSVPGRGDDKQDCMAARVQAAFPDALIVHRLDMGTSGLLVLARGAAMHRLLSIAFLQRKVGKRYVAIVAGRMTQAEGEIDLPLITDWPNRPRQKVHHDIGKPSLTRYRVLSRDADSTRVELEPLTGRSHQLRVHLQQIGHPILGDELYADAGSVARAPRLLLHAESLSFTHPVSGETMHFQSPAPF
ncbi:RluA family pseudouridine synthase [Uliginosibacterium sp. H1]|uniref:RluA family pseudouridine synthase n=1 Tax=Uliginosibacterium sp. H1 TaxID=3114757 RepID=UPI002E1845B5|nr:RluA family pseudouridine synthase [Uliginosibacterium sp. H1]